MNKYETKILLVDDKEENLLALESTLACEDYVIHKVTTGKEALEHLLVHSYVAALLDVQMPEMNGFELAELMRSKKSTKHIPIIFVTAGAIDPKFTFMGYEAGAVDFLYKPLDVRVVKSKVKIFAELAQSKHTIEAQVVKLQEALRSRDDFLSMASHELKTPMTSLKLNVQILAKKLSSFAEEHGGLEKLDKTLNSMNGQLKRLNILVDDLLDSTRIRSGMLTMRKESIDFSKLIHNVLENTGPELTKAGCKVTGTISDGIVLDCDPYRMEQVFLNLLTNVIRYAPESHVKVELEKRENHICLRVSDSGPGIPEEVLPLIFNRFERGNMPKDNSGLGLGLYIVKEIVSLHKGSIGVESEIQQGSTFIIKLPVTP